MIRYNEIYKYDLMDGSRAQKAKSRNKKENAE